MRRSLSTAVTWASVAYGLVFPRFLKQASDWASAARSLATPLGVAACVFLVLVLVQEFALYNPSPDVRRTPLALPGVILVGVALAFLIGGALTFALAPERDILRLRVPIQPHSHRAPLPLTTRSSSRPARRTWSAVAKSRSGVAWAKRARIFW